MYHGVLDVQLEHTTPVEIQVLHLKPFVKAALLDKCQKRVS